MRTRDLFWYDVGLVIGVLLAAVRPVLRLVRGRATRSMD
jgi:hypothetical protein